MKNQVCLIDILPNIQLLECHKHDKRMLSFICVSKECNHYMKPACPKCLDESHRTHEGILLENYLEFIEKMALAFEEKLMENDQVKNKEISLDQLLGDDFYKQTLKEAYQWQQLSDVCSRISQIQTQLAKKIYQHNDEDFMQFEENILQLLKIKKGSELEQHTQKFKKVIAYNNEKQDVMFKVGQFSDAHKYLQELVFNTQQLKDDTISPTLQEILNSCNKTIMKIQEQQGEQNTIREYVWRARCEKILKEGDRLWGYDKYMSQQEWGVEQVDQWGVWDWKYPEIIPCGGRMDNDTRGKFLCPECYENKLPKGLREKLKKFDGTPDNVLEF